MDLADVPSQLNVSFPMLFWNDSRLINIILWVVTTCSIYLRLFLRRHISWYQACSLLFFTIFHEWPLVRLSALRLKKVCRVMLDNPAFNLNTSSRLALLRRSWSVHNPSLRMPLSLTVSDIFNVECHALTSKRSWRSRSFILVSIHFSFLSIGSQY